MVFLRSLVGSNRGVVRNAMIGRMGTKDEEEHGDGVEVVGTSNGVEAAHVLTAHYLEEWWGGSGGGGCPPPLLPAYESGRDKDQCTMVVGRENTLRKILIQSHLLRTYIMT